MRALNLPRYLRAVDVKVGLIFQIAYLVEPNTYLLEKYYGKDCDCCWFPARKRFPGTARKRN